MRIKITRIVLLTLVLMLNMNLIYCQITTNEPRVGAHLQCVPDPIRFPEG